MTSVTVVNDFASNLHEKFQRIIEIHPRLLDAVPPEPIEPKYGTFHFKHADVWAEALNGKIRSPSAAVHELVGPFHAYGGCLEPIWKAGRLDWYDPKTPARDGDIVLIRWAPEVLAEMYERNSNKPDWLDKYADVNPIATKYLRALGNEYWLVTNGSMLRLGNNQILGVLRYSEQSSVTSNIEPNAATEVAVIVEPADGSQTYSAATQPVFESVGLNGTASYTSPVSTATQVNVAWSAQARISNTTSGVAVGEARLRVRVFINGSEVWNQHLVLEGYTGSADWGNFSGSRDFAVPAGQTIDVYFQTDRSFSTGGSSPAQTMFWREALICIVGQKR